MGCRWIRWLGTNCGCGRLVKASAFQAEVRSSILRIRSSLLAGSTQGERARLLTGNEVGSIPTLPAISLGIYRRVLVNDADSKPAQESSILLRRCQSISSGDVREQANPAGREPASERIDTATSPHFIQQARLAQWQCRSLVNCRRGFDSFAGHHLRRV